MLWIYRMVPVSWFIPPSHFTLFLWEARWYSSLCLLFLSLIGCSSTKLQTSGSCSAYFTDKSICLVPWLPKANQDVVRDIIKQTLSKGSVDARFMDEEEWRISAAGINNPLDTAQFPQLMKMGYSHLLLIREKDFKSQSIVKYYTPFEMMMNNELTNFNPTWNQNGNTSEVVLELVALHHPAFTKSITSKTVIGPVRIRHDDGGETQANTSSVLIARNKAIRKGLKSLLKECK